MQAALLQFLTVARRGRELGWNYGGVRESNEGANEVRRASRRPRGSQGVNHTGRLAFCRSTGFTVGSI
jgi:hypothetical protein